MVYFDFNMFQFHLLQHYFLFLLRGHINVISSCCFSSDEHLLATGSWDKNIQIWDIATGVYRYRTGLSLSLNDSSVALIFRPVTNLLLMDHATTG